MPDEQTRPPSDEHAQREDESQAAVAEATTASGYSYTVVGDDGGASAPPAVAGGAGGSGGPHPLLLVLLALVPAVIAGVAVWFIASSGGGGDKARVNRDVTNVLNAFSQGQDGTVVTRYEGQLPPGYPSDLPSYPNAKVVSSVRQLQGNTASYLVIYDTKDQRSKVASFFADKFAADPWQIDGGSDGRDSTLHRYSKIDDADITGLVLAAQSKEDKLTTIVQSVQVASGGKDAAKTPFTPGSARSLPDGFPDGVPAYKDALPIQSAFQKQAAGSTFVVSFISKDSASDVLDFYRAAFKDGGLTVEDADGSQSALEGAAAIQFGDSTQSLTGQIVAGTFAEDKNYTQIDVQVRVTSQ